jgi:uncharacterized OB-fold protein
MCPACHSIESTWDAMTGTGVIWSFVIPHPPLLPAFNDLAPYPVVLVALDEDPKIRLVGNLVAADGGAINEIDPATIEIGRSVRASFRPVGDDLALVHWILA